MIGFIINEILLPDIRPKKVPLYSDVLTFKLIDTLFPIVRPVILSLFDDIDDKQDVEEIPLMDIVH